MVRSRWCDRSIDRSIWCVCDGVHAPAASAPEESGGAPSSPSAVAAAAAARAGSVVRHRPILMASGPRLGHYYIAYLLVDGTWRTRRRFYCAVTHDVASGAQYGRAGSAVWVRSQPR